MHAGGGLEFQLDFVSTPAPIPERALIHTATTTPAALCSPDQVLGSASVLSSTSTLKAAPQVSAFDKVKPTKRGPQPCVITKSASLTTWFKPAASRDVIEADRRRMDSLHMSTMEKRAQADHALANQRSINKTEHARDRQARKRQRDREEDITSGRRDRDGKLTKIAKVMVLSDSLPSTSLNVAEASRPKRTLEEHERQQRGTSGRPRTVDYKKAVLTNWTSPLLWTHIARAAVRNAPKMSPTDICRDLKLLDPILFKVLVPQTVSRWIDRSGEAPRWSSKTLDRVAAGYQPGGLTTRVGALVRFTLHSTANNSNQ